MPPAAARRAHVLVLVGFVASTVVLWWSHRFALLAALGVPTMELPFADARTITGCSVALERGLDPMYANPGDPWGRPLNYPRVWLLLARCGLAPQHTELLAAVFALLFAIGLACTVPLVRTRHAVLVFALALFAPAVWFAIERGNADLLLFGLCAAAALLAPRQPPVAGALVGLAAALKLYPIAALAGCVDERARRSLATMLPVAALFAGYVWWQRADLAAIGAATQHVPAIAYGIAIVPELVAKNTGLPFAMLLSAAAALLLAVVAAGVQLRLRVRLGAAGTPATLAAFRTGAAVFLGSYCVGTSFDYRLIFLLLVVPQLALWSTHGTVGLRRAARAATGAALLALWNLTWRQGLARMTGTAMLGLLGDELVTASLWALLAVLLALSAPDWLLPAPRRGAPHLDG